MFLQAKKFRSFGGTKRTEHGIEKIGQGIGKVGQGKLH